MAKPQRRAVSLLWGEVRPQKRFCPLQTCSPHSKPSQPPLGAWRAGRVHPHLFSVWQLGDALSFPHYSPSFRRRRAACVGTQSILPCSVREKTCRGFTATGRGQTTKAFLPASNVLSSLKTVTATPRGLACGTSSSSFILGLAVGSPSFRRRRAACVGTQSILPCSVRTPCWPPVSPALHTPSTRTRTPRALLRGGGCRCSRFGPATHFSLGNIPPASTGFNWR